MRRQHQIKGGGPIAYWAAMRALTKRDGGFASRDIAERCQAASVNTVECYVRSCFRAGLLDEAGERPSDNSLGPKTIKLFAVKVTAPEGAPFEKPERAGILGAVHQHLWTAMRGLPQFTTRELAATASTDEISISATTAQIYCWKLERAGYLQVLGKSGRFRVLRIRPGRNSGPLPPAITGAGAVIDRNPRGQRRRAS